MRLHGRRYIPPAPRKHWTTLPPIPGFTRIPDQHDQRMVTCNLCGQELPSLGTGGHRQGRRCTDRKRP